MKNKPNRTQFAQTVARAYFNQYVTYERPVMNDPQIYYNPDTGLFGSCSTLTPLSGGEVQVDVLEEGVFGEPSTLDGLADYLAEECDDYWESVLSKIENA